MIYKSGVDEDLTLSDSEKPRYLLPEGCKDLYDVIRRQEEDAALQKQKAAISAVLEKLASMATKSPKIYEDLSDALKKHFKETSKELPLYVTLPDSVTVGELADMLHLKAFKLISVLVKFQIFASADSTLTFATASKVCAKLGVAVQKAGDF
jgi:hypothetical protein